MVTMFLIAPTFFVIRKFQLHICPCGGMNLQRTCACLLTSSLVTKFSAGNGTTSSFAMTANDVTDSFHKNNPSRINLDFRMLVRGKDGEPIGEEDIHCVGFFDHWMKKSSEGKRNGKNSY